MNATATRKPRQRRSHQRSVKVLVEPAAGNPMMFLRITQDGKPGYYWVSPLVSDFGRAFRFEKPAPEVDVYDVLLEPSGDSCTCKGHTYGGYCKHVDACRALIGAGKLS
jgi:hypothetical protein